MRRLVGTLIAIVMFASSGICQSNTATQSDKTTADRHVTGTEPSTDKPSGELNVQEASRITLRPPKDVKATQKGDSVVLTWTAPSQRAVEYKVFRFEGTGEKPTEIGRTADSHFKIDAKSEREYAHGVAAIDYRGNESPVSAPVKTETPAAK